MIRRVLVIAWAAAAAGPAPGAAQAPAYRAAWSSWAVAVGAGGFAALPGILRLPRGAPPCAPCDPAGLPGIDRWVVGLESHGAATGSDVLLLGVAGGALVASVSGVSADRARGDAAVLVNAVAWTSVAAEWTKALIHRSRPVLYTAQAASAARDRDNRRSFPSGHATAAFALATSYAVMAQRQHLPHAIRNDVLLFSGAAGVGALRIAAGRHFTTDVLGGALLGAGVGWLTAHLYPTRP